MRSFRPIRSRNLAGAAGTVVAGHLHEGDLAFDVQPLHQLGGEEEGTVQHSDEEGALVVRTSLRSSAATRSTASLHLGLWNEGLEFQVVQTDACHQGAERRRDMGPASGGKVNDRCGDRSSTRAHTGNKEALLSERCATTLSLLFCWWATLPVAGRRGTLAYRCALRGHGLYGPHPHRCVERAHEPRGLAGLEKPTAGCSTRAIS